MKSERALIPRWSRILALVLLASLAAACGPPGEVTDPTKLGPDGRPRPEVKEEALKKFKEGIDKFSSNPPAAKKAFEEAVDEDETFGEAWYNLGLIRESSGDLEGAVEAYERAVASRPDLGDAYVNLGMIYLERGERAKAKDLFLAVVSEESGVEPFHVAANLNLGLIYRLEGEEMVAQSNQGTNTETSMEEGQVNKRVYTVSDDAKYRFADAVRHVRKALAGDSNNIVSYENLAAIYYDLDSLEVATLVCEQAIQKQTEYNEELAGMMGEGKISQGEHDAKFITDAQMAAVYNTYGLIWLARGEVALAFHNFREAVARRPDFTPALLNVAGVAVNVQDYQTAYDTYGAILAKHPKDREARLSQAVAARGLGNLAEAEQVYTALLQEDPQFSPAKFNLAILYQEYHRDLHKAKSIYEEFLGMSTAAEFPVRVAEAQARIKQIEEIWEESKKAEAQQKKMEEEMRQLQELQKQQEEEYKKLQEQENGGAGAPPEGGATVAPESSDGATAP